MEQFEEKKGVQENKESEKIVFSFEFNTDKEEMREEYQGIDITFYARASKEKWRIDICINISPGRGDKKELERMKVVLKQYSKVITEGVVKTGFIEFENMEKGIYTVEFTLREIKGNNYFDTYAV